MNILSPRPQKRRSRHYMRYRLEGHDEGHGQSENLTNSITRDYTNIYFRGGGGGYKTRVCAQIFQILIVLTKQG